jgi:site-specific DNA-cytosine methylase
LLWGFETPEGQLLLEPLRWAQALNPHWVVVENVDGLPDEMLVPLVEGLQALYPHVSVLRLNARDWLPQNRGHVFVVGGPGPGPAPVGTGGKRFAEIADGRGAEPVQVNHLRYALRKRYAVPVVTLDDVLPTVATRPYSQRWTAFVMTEPGCLRFPTFLEAARAQGFPDDHPLHELHQRHPAIAWRLLGNAVPVALAQALLTTIVVSEVNR